MSVKIYMEKNHLDDFLTRLVKESVAVEEIDENTLRLIFDDNSTFPIDKELYQKFKK